MAIFGTLSDNLHPRLSLQSMHASRIAITRDLAPCFLAIDPLRHWRPGVGFGHAIWLRFSMPKDPSSKLVPTPSAEFHLQPAALVSVPSPQLQTHPCPFTVLPAG
jgi:hypothetical protein